MDLLPFKRRQIPKKTADALYQKMTSWATLHKHLTEEKPTLYTLEAMILTERGRLDRTQIKERLLSLHAKELKRLRKLATPDHKLESSMQKECLKYLRDKGCLLYRFYDADVPDRLVIPTYKPAFMVEFKAYGKDLRAAQEVEVTTIRTQGMVVLVVNKYEDIFQCEQGGLI